MGYLSRTDRLATVIAEKVCTAVDLGDTSTRVRDYADIWILSRRHDLDAANLRAALAATAAHRGLTPKPLTEAIGDIVNLRRGVYAAFLTRVEDDTLSLPADLSQLVENVTTFVDPLLSEQPLDTWSATLQRWSAPRLEAAAQAKPV